MTAHLFEASTARSSRDRILDYLESQGGRVASSDGCNLTAAMAEGAGYASIAALNAMLARMERDGLIEREVRGKRTYGVSLTKPGRNGKESVPQRARRSAPQASRTMAPTAASGLRASELLFALSNLITGLQAQNEELAGRVSALEEIVMPSKRGHSRAA